MFLVTADVTCPCSGSVHGRQQAGSLCRVLQHTGMGHSPPQQHSSGHTFWVPQQLSHWKEQVATEKDRQ